jgi:molybdopterin-dependent oxidoreductase alpha subunit
MPIPAAQPPTDFTGLTQEKPAEVAAGMTAVVSAMKHVFGAMPIDRGLKSLLSLNQKGGIDCPSCAWPDPDHERSEIAEFCENGAKAIADEATTRKAGPVFFQKYSVAELAAKSDYWLGQQGRLTHPLVIREGATHYEKISWEDAFTLIAQHLNTLHSPNEALFYTSGRSSNEAAFLYQLFARQFGTNNMPDCANMCHDSSGVALSQTLGLGKGSVTLDDFEHAEVIVIMGQNPGTNHPRMLASLEKAKKNGASIVAINPLVETGLLAFKDPKTIEGIVGKGTPLTDLYLQIRINGDLALLKAIAKLLYQAEQQSPNQVFDHHFIQENTAGYQAFIDDINQYDLDSLIADTGLSFEKVQFFTNLIAHKKRIIVCWAMGLTQHKNAVPTIREVVNLLLLKGSIGKKGAGTCPVRGHSNVQGDRTMGIMTLPKTEFLDRLQAVFGFDPPREKGLDTVQSIKAMHSGKAKVFFALGGNFLSASPDTEYVAQALRNCTLTAHVSTKLNRSHLVHGKTALILPCLGRTDEDRQAGGVQFVSVENSMGIVHSSKGVLTPPSEHLLSEPAIVAQLAQATLGERSTINWEKLTHHYDNIRQLITKTVAGFEAYNDKVREDGGYYLPNAPRDGKFITPNKKAHFTINTWEAIPLKLGEYLMMTIRSHDQFNTTVYGLNDRYRGIFNERRIIFMNPQDMEKDNFKTYEVVNLYNYMGGVERVAEKFIVVPYNIPPRCVAAYFPEANVLVPIDSVADGSNTPASKSVVITIEKIK